MTIIYKRIGELLKQERERKNISIEEITKATHIGKKYILAIEEGDISVFAALIYYKGFCRNYANYIGIEKEEIEALLKEVDKEYKPSSSRIKQQIREKPEAIPLLGRKLTSFLIILFLGIILLFIILIISFQYKKVKSMQTSMQQNISWVNEF